jgi:hypothetical protein
MRKEGSRKILTQVSHPIGYAKKSGYFLSDFIKKVLWSRAIFLKKSFEKSIPGIFALLEQSFRKLER